MAADEDNFDIDFYAEGDGNGDAATGQNDEGDYYDEDEHTFTIDEPQPDPPPVERTESNRESVTNDVPTGPRAGAPKPSDPKPGSPATAPSQGVKRKGSPNDREVEPGATTALMLSDLHWWITEDDIRGWVNQAAAEDDLKEITFNEHKVNGKSKG